MSDVLILAPSRKTRGGITSVVKEYEKTNLWQEFNCKWIETSIDTNNFLKILYFLRSYFIFIINLPVCKIVHIHLSERTTVLRKNFFFWPSYWSGKKIIIHFHAYSPESTIRGKYRNIYEKLFSKADAVIVLSGYWQKEIISTFGGKIKTHIIFNPCPGGFNSNFNTINKKQKYILYAGILDQRKGYEDLIMAFSRIAKDYPEWKLVFAGNGEIEKGRKLASVLQIENQIIFKGWVTGSAKEQLFKDASVYCLPSYAEGFPMSVIEAWSYGIPVITTPVGGLPDVIEHGKNAMVFKPGDIDNLTKGLTELITDKNLRQKLSETSFIIAKDLFNIENISLQMSDLYKHLLNGAQSNFIPD